MIKKKWSLKTIIIFFICIVVSVSLLITGVLVSQSSSDRVKKYEEDKAFQVSKMIALSPQIIDGLTGKASEAGIQSFTTEIQKATGVEFIVVMDMNGIRKSHPNPDMIGKKFVGGDERDALQGKETSSISAGTLGKSLRTFTPVFDPNHKQVGVVAVGISLGSLDKVQSEVRTNIAVGILIGLLIGIIGAMFVANYIKKILFGMEPAAIAKLLEECNAMLHSVREGIIAVDQEERISLVNKSGLTILQKAGLNEDPIGKKIDSYLWNTKLNQVLKTGQVDLDEELDINGVKVIVNRVPIVVDGKIVGALATIRDLTEMKQLAEQLTGVKQYAQTLRAQSHEFMNRLHVILGMIHLKEYEKLSKFIYELVNHSQNEIGIVTKNIKNPSLAGFFIGKLSFAREKNVHFQILIENPIPDIPDIDIIHDLITILGNLIDNAIDAVQESERREIELTMKYENMHIQIEIQDMGVGIREEEQEKIFVKGFSTKGLNRGYGLYLVEHLVNKHHGHITVCSDKKQGSIFHVDILWMKNGEEYD